LRGKVLAAGLPVCNRALVILRELRDWTQEELAQAAGISRLTVGTYEQGQQELSMRKLWHLARVMGHSPRKIREALALAQPEAPPLGRWVGPVYFSPAESHEIRELSYSASRRAEPSFHKLLEQARVLEAVAEARAEAQDLWAALRAERRWRAIVQERPEYQTWAFAELLCEESIRAAPSKPDRALELAKMAVLVAELVPGDEGWRSRVQGYAQAHLGNAWRVLGKMTAANQAFSQAGELWRSGKGGDSSRLLNEGRIFGLEASLRREQGRPYEALALLKEGLSVSNHKEKGNLLINKAKALQVAENYVEAIAALREAAQYVQPRDLRLAFALRFELAVSLWHLKRFTEALQLLPEIQGLALQLGQKIDTLRTSWLEAQILASMGRLVESVERLSAVRYEFMALDMAYDAALVSLALAEVLLQLHRIPEVKILAREMAPIFKSQGVHRKALQALLLFSRAAEAERATIDLVRSIGEYLRRARARPDLEYTHAEG
jgi:transcriptional regulator with XRE-family HTH domain